MLTRPAAVPGRDAGITLVELLVTMTLMSIVGALTLTWLLGSSQAVGTTTTASYATADARTLLQDWSGLLAPADTPVNGPASLAAQPSGSAVPTSFADPTTVPTGVTTGRLLAIGASYLIFTSDLGNRTSSCAPQCARSDTTTVTLALGSAPFLGSLQQTLQRSGTSRAATMVAGGVAVTPGTPAGAGCGIFQPYDATGSALPCTAAALPATTSMVIAFTVTPYTGTTASGRPQAYSTAVAIGNPS